MSNDFFDNQKLRKKAGTEYFNRLENRKEIAKNIPDINLDDTVVVRDYDIFYSVGEPININNNTPYKNYAFDMVKYFHGHSLIKDGDAFIEDKKVILAFSNDNNSAFIGVGDNLLQVRRDIMLRIIAKRMVKGRGK